MSTKNQVGALIEPKKKEISEIEKEMSFYKKAMNEKKKLAPFYRLGIIVKKINQAHLFMDNYQISKDNGVHNSSYMDEAKKRLSQVFSEIEKVVSLKIDEPLDFNREQLDAIKPFDPKKKLNFYKHMQKSIERMITLYGDNTKWKWSFPDFWSKLAVAGKNLIDFREIERIRDPREEFYYDRQEMLNLIKEGLFDASGHYRNKYELSTKSKNDLLHAVRLLESLKRIAMLTGDPETIKKCKSGIDTYKSRIETEDDPKKAKKGKKKK